MSQPSVKSRRIPVIDMNHNSYVGDICNELAAALRERGLQSEGLVYRVVRTTDIPNVRRYGTDKYDPSYPPEYSALQYIDRSIIEDLGLEENDAFFGLHSKGHEMLEYEVSKKSHSDDPAVSVYDDAQLGQAPGSAVFYFLDPKRKKDALVAVFKLEIE